MKARPECLPLAFGLLAGLSLGATPVSSGARSTDADMCPAGRYVVSGEPIVLGQAEPAVTSLLIGKRHISIDKACDAKRARRIKTNENGVMKIRARWRSCDGLEGRVRFRGKIVQDCTKLEGRLRARGLERKFEALLTRAVADLQVARSCDDVLEALQSKAISEMVRLVTANEEYALWWLRQGRGLGCYDVGGAAKADAPGIGGDDAAAGIPATESATENGASSYSTTNIQVEGIDEADFVKNDGSYIYILAGGALQIIAAWPPEQARIVSSTEIEGEATKLYVHGERAVVYSSVWVTPTLDPSLTSDKAARRSPRECTRGSSCGFLGDGAFLKITVLDISNRTDPALLRETLFEGSYLNSRRVENAIYTAVVFQEPTFPELSYWPEELTGYLWDCAAEIPYDEAQITDLFAKLTRDNAEKIRQLTMSDLMPIIIDTLYLDGEPVHVASPLVDCENFLISQDDDGTNLISLVAFDMGALDSYGVTTVAGRPGAVYASGESLYVAARQYRNQMHSWYFDAMEGDEAGEATTVHKFVLSPETPDSRYAGSGVVKGHILNQFSMDEHRGHLRIATTSRGLANRATHSTVSILAEWPGGLEVVGQIDGIAPTEDIRSARFHGDVGFIVTFKKTDPLFVLDLSEPTDPSIKGELKIPGFSTYLHLMDDDHLLTIGHDANDQGSFAWFTGIQLQIMDVSSLSNPRLVHKEIIGTRGSTSDATMNHLAFNYFADKDLLALPMVICEESPGGGYYGTSLTFSGLLVYRATVGGGFEQLGGVPHEIPEAGLGYRVGCWNWWTDPTSQVKRSIFMDDFVYSIALDRINISSMDDLENPVATVDLTD